MVHKSEPLLPKNYVPASAVEHNHKPEPLQQKSPYAVPVVPLTSDQHQYTADSQAHPRQSGSYPAGLLVVEEADFRAAGSL